MVRYRRMLLVVALVSFLAASPTAEFTTPVVSGAESTAATMHVDLAVTLVASEGPVVAHLQLPGEPVEVHPLVERGDGRWGAMLEVRRADWHVVFEDVSGGLLSEQHTFTGLGLDPALLGVATTIGATVAGPAPAPLKPALLAGTVALLVGIATWYGAGRSRSNRRTPRHLRR